MIKAILIALGVRSQCCGAKPYQCASYFKCWKCNARTFARPFFHSIAVWLGHRSKCCEARTEYHQGYDQSYCTCCKRRCS